MGCRENSIELVSKILPSCPFSRSAFAHMCKWAEWAKLQHEAVDSNILSLSTSKIKRINETDQVQCVDSETLYNTLLKPSKCSFLMCAGILQIFFSYLLRAVSLEEGDWIKEIQQLPKSITKHETLSWLHDPMPSMTDWRNYHMDFVLSGIHGAVLKCWNILVFVISQVLRIWDPWTSWVRRSDWCDASTSAHKCHSQQQQFWKQETLAKRLKRFLVTGALWQCHVLLCLCPTQVTMGPAFTSQLHWQSWGSAAERRVPRGAQCLWKLKKLTLWLHPSIPIYANLWFYHAPWSKPFLISYPSLSPQGPTLHLFEKPCKTCHGDMKKTVCFKCLSNLCDRDFPLWFGSQTSCRDSSLDRQEVAESSATRSCASSCATRAERCRAVFGFRVSRWRSRRRTRSIGSDGRRPESSQTLGKRWFLRPGHQVDFERVFRL